MFLFYMSRRQENCEWWFWIVPLEEITRNATYENILAYHSIHPIPDSSLIGRRTAWTAHIVASNLWIRSLGSQSSHPRGWEKTPHDLNQNPHFCGIVNVPVKKKREKKKQKISNKKKLGYWYCKIFKCTHVSALIN